MTVLEANNRVLLLDRDGVLNEDLPESVTSLADLRLAPGAAAGARTLVAAGFVLLVITNQACVGRGQLERSDLDAINADLNRRLGGAISEFFVCPHAADAGCDCRKPAAGLLERAHAAWGFDRETTWFVGDAARDVEAARAFGCRPALLTIGKGSRTRIHFPDVPAWDDLYTFARWLTQGSGTSGVSDGR